MRKLLYFIFILLFLFVMMFIIYYSKWEYMWTPANHLPHYVIHNNKSDTLRVIMIGDSWAAIHSLAKMDTFLQRYLEYLLRRPVTVISKGTGGEKSKGIYQKMYETGEHGTKQLLISGVDYCVISAGINDAATNLGTKQFCMNYYMILDLLLANGIRPVILEIPDVDIWNLYGGKPKKDLLVDYLRSIMTHCGMYNYSEYRDALLTMLQKEKMMSRVIYVEMSGWNGKNTMIDKSLFMKDGIHLNKRGYEKLDSCVAKSIEIDLNKAVDTNFVK